ncbi:hypothetical protein BFJ66_g17651 [Fusarium oxysporum f. sp. cepae]|uniref:Uncharacterized protein n=1 Tax=Fusarium oxysporum f. sp. cepae TaxID=396571 RepID=A0A3L6MRU7_FUSOX|nr:hypothetical protein BFJ65_g17777 [Fusarium oxysporum f. sp. cepae]RKK19009.1 hypothetical protein BFJ67_g17646 [Fusarium oxysporum f. sp. cepae]RKK21273.1 hypothetical protein BFJ66_g17651 [Fusarium oxysporum f. sp. cepae]
MATDRRYFLALYEAVASLVPAIAALPHATFSLCVLATVSTKDRGQAARGGFGRGAAP